ncbi:unnamed protein product [Symbiodinium natans]|uniref:Uncharacterized protein n=1 Tax=Symbiodinium natans TaxID=878477 RepID=A0A812MSL7_9DINO|nr:unnamed protein product [Symbiodinium natans]
MLLPLASISRRSARPKTQTDHPHQPKVLSCETCLSVETENFAKKAKDGRLPWFPDSSKIADIVTKLRNAAPQITYVLSVLGTEWGEDLAAREILFREKLYDTAFLDQLWPCETCKHAEQLPEVQQEIQLCGHVRSLRNFIEGRLNSNEQTIPKVKDFLDKLKVGLLDEKIAAAISPEQDQNVDWSEVEFVKVELGSILNQTRQYAISHQAATSDSTGTAKAEELEAQLKRDIAANEADFDRRVRQRTEAADAGRHAAEERAQKAEQVAKDAEKKTRQLEAQVEEQKTRIEDLEAALKQEAAKASKAQGLEDQLKEERTKRRADQEKLAECQRLQLQLRAVSTSFEHILPNAEVA